MLKRIVPAILFAASVLIVGSVAIKPAVSQLIYGNTFPFWNVGSGGLTVTGTTTTAGITNTGALSTTTLTSTGAYTPTGGITGVTTSSVASVGHVGEMLSAISTGGTTATVLTTGTAAGVVCKALTAGDWDVDGSMLFSATAAGISSVAAGITANTASAVLGAPGTYVKHSPQSVLAISDTSAITVTIPRVPLQLNASTTYCTTALAAFNGTALGAIGVINARRVR